MLIPHCIRIYCCYLYKWHPTDIFGGLVLWYCEGNACLSPMAPALNSSWKSWRGGGVHGVWYSQHDPTGIRYCFADSMYQRMMTWQHVNFLLKWNVDHTLQVSGDWWWLSWWQHWWVTWRPSLTVLVLCSLSMSMADSEQRLQWGNSWLWEGSFILRLQLERSMLHVFVFIFLLFKFGIQQC